MGNTPSKASSLYDFNRQKLSSEHDIRPADLGSKNKLGTCRGDRLDRSKEYTRMSAWHQSDPEIAGIDLTVHNVYYYGCASTDSKSNWSTDTVEIFWGPRMSYEQRDSNSREQVQASYIQADIRKSPFREACIQLLVNTNQV